MNWRNSVHLFSSVCEQTCIEIALYCFTGRPPRAHRCCWYKGNKKRKWGVNVLLGARAVGMLLSPSPASSACLGQRNEGLSWKQVYVEHLKWQCLELGEHLRVSSGPAFEEAESLQVMPAYGLENGIFCDPKATSAIWLSVRLPSSVKSHICRINQGSVPVLGQNQVQLSGCWQSQAWALVNLLTCT